MPRHYIEHHNYHIVVMIDQYVQARIHQIIREKKVKIVSFTDIYAADSSLSYFLPACKLVIFLLIPKSQNLIAVFETKIFEDFMSL